MFKEFSLGELFEASKGDVDLQQKDINGKGHYFINSGLDNRGIKGKTDRPAKVFPANTITIDFWGNAYYRDFEYKLATHNHVFSLTGEVIKDIATGLYIESLMSEFPKMFSYNNMATWNKLKILKILLPVKKAAASDHDYTADDIDYEYMRSRIAELERSRIAELERSRIAELDAYLKATGLDDYELTEEDREVLSTDTTQVKRKNFSLGDLFAAFTGDVDLQQKDINDKGEYFVNSGVANLGIKGKTDRPAKVFPANTITIDFWGNAYYRDFEYKLATHNHVFSLTGEVIKNRLVGLYLVSLFSEFPKLFSYNNMATWNKLKKMKIALPITSVGEVDYAYMENYIRAMEKVTIADVVKYKDKVIETTKAVVEQ